MADTDHRFHPLLESADSGKPYAPRKKRTLRSLGMAVHRSHAYWAKQPSGKAVFFIHGYRGGSLSTWRQFPDLLKSRNAFANTDLIFYGYPSTGPIRTNGERLQVVLKALISAPLPFMPRAIQDDRSSFAYSDVLIVAHSVGAIVTRKAMLDATDPGGENWPGKCRMVLFAPADNGAVSAIELFVDSLPYGLNRLGRAIRVSDPVIDQVLENSPKSVLPDLKKETERLVIAGASHLRAELIVWPENDIVVVSEEDFLDQPNSEARHDPPPDTTHGTVCKPTPTYEEPVNIVEQHH